MRTTPAKDPCGCFWALLCPLLSVPRPDRSRLILARPERSRRILRLILAVPQEAGSQMQVAHVVLSRLEA